MAYNISKLIEKSMINTDVRSLRCHSFIVRTLYFNPILFSAIMCGIKHHIEFDALLVEMTLSLYQETPQLTPNHSELEIKLMRKTLAIKKFLLKVDFCCSV